MPCGVALIEGPAFAECLLEMLATAVATADAMQHAQAVHRLCSTQARLPCVTANT